MVRLDERVSLIRQIGLFQSVDPAELESIAQQMTENTFKDGEVVFLEGDAGDRLYLILSGTMHVYVERESSVITYDHLQLRAASAFEMYRQRRGRIESHQIVGFLMFDPEFPRSLTHCVRNAQESLEGITKLASSRAAVNPAAVNLGAALSELEVARPLSENSAIFFQEIINNGLHEVLSAFQTRLNEFGQALFDRYFGLSRVA
jgi:uncharacterized alpha-E superfamily protein